MRPIQIAVLLVVAFTAGLFAQTKEATATIPTVAYVYVGEKTTSGKIAVFSAKSNGSLTVVSGSPFSGPSQSVAVNSGFVFATDGTNISTYSRLGNGGLHKSSIIDGSVCAGYPDLYVLGLTLDHSGSSLYPGLYLNTGDDCFADFAVQHNGSLQFQSSTYIGAAEIGVLEFSNNNQFAYGVGCARQDWVIDGFDRGPGGGLVMFNPAAEIPPVPSSISIDDIFFECPSPAAASAKGYLAVAYFFYPWNSSTNYSEYIATYEINSSGNLDLVTNSEEVTKFGTFTAINTLRFDPTGTYLAAAGQGGLELFKLKSNGTLARVGNVLEPKLTFLDVKWDNDGHLYAISDSALYLFTLHSTGLTVTGSPHPLANAQSLAVLPVK